MEHWDNKKHCILKYIVKANELTQAEKNRNIGIAACNHNMLYLSDLSNECGLYSDEIISALGRLRKDGFLNEYKKLPDLGYSFVLTNDFEEKCKSFLGDLDPSAPPVYDSKRKTLIFLGKEIRITKSAQTYPDELLAVIFSDVEKKWDNDEIFEKWYGKEKKYWEEAANLKRIYHAGVNINKIIERKTGVLDFLTVSTKSVQITQKYLKKSL